MRRAFDCMGQVESRVTVDSSSTAVTCLSSRRRRFSMSSLRRGSFSMRGRSFGMRRRSSVSAFRHIELARHRIPDDRSQPVRDIHATARMLASGYSAKCWSNTDKTADRREHCQHCERHPHRRRRLVRDVRAVMTAVPVRRDVMRHVFVYWSNMLAGLVSRAISGGGVCRVVWR